MVGFLDFGLFDEHNLVVKVNIGSNITHIHGLATILLWYEEGNL